MKIAGVILLVFGIIGTIVFGVQAINQSENFRLFVVDVAVSSANWTPVIISAAILIVGIILTSAGERK